MQTLIANQTSAGSGNWVSVAPLPIWFEALGTFDGCTVHLEFTRDFGTTVHELTTMTGPNISKVEVPQGQVRARVSSAGASTDVTARF